MRTFPHANFNPLQMLKDLVMNFMYFLHKGWLTDSINHSVMRENIFKGYILRFWSCKLPAVITDSLYKLS